MLLGDLDAHDAEGEELADEGGVHLLGVVHLAHEWCDLFGGEAADGVADHLLDLLDVGAGERVSVLLNSLGATPHEELYILYRAVARRLEAKRVSIVAPLVGRYATSMEMTGASLTIQRLDAELEALLRAPAHCPFWSH